MKNKILLSLTFAVCCCASSWAQSKSSSDVTVRVDGKKMPLDSLVGAMGSQFGGTIAGLFKSMNFDATASGFSFNFDDKELDGFAASIESMVENFTKNLEFELNNVKPEELSNDGKNNSSINGYTGDDLLRDIEREFGSKVEVFESMKIKLKDEKVSLDVRAKLKNGKVITKYYDDLGKYKKQGRE